MSPIEDSVGVAEVRVCRMRTGIEVQMSAADRIQLDAIVADRNTPQKHVWRAQIVLLTADGCGTAEIMRVAGVSKTAVWRWQERFMTHGVAGLLRDKTRPSRIPPLEAQTVARVVAATQADPPGEATHWTAVAMAKISGHQRQFGATHLAHARFAAASDPSVQAVQRSAVRQQAARDRRALRRATGARRRASRSMRRAKSRRSTAPSRACR